MSFEKKLKKQKTYTMVATGGIGLMLAGLACLLVAIPFDQKFEKIAKQNGYDEFNKTYKQQVFDDLVLDYQNGEISKETLINKGKYIKDYDCEKFIYEYTTPEAIEQLKNAEETKNALVVSASGITAAGFAGAIVGLFGMNENHSNKKILDSLNEIEGKQEKGK